MRTTLRAALLLVALVVVVACAKRLPQQQLDSRFRPLALHADHYVALGYDRELHLIETQSGREERLTDDGLVKREAVLSDRYIAWTAEREPSSEERVALRIPVDIFLYDRRTAKAKRITATSAPRRELSMQGKWLVWADKRNELEEDYTDYDIYGYDLENEVERPLVVAPGAQVGPSVYGTYLVWQDNRKSPSRDTIRAGCGNCPDNRSDIYLYDLSSGKERPLAEDKWLKADPVVYENLVAWVTYRDLFASRIVLLDLATGKGRTVTPSGMAATQPLLTAGHLLWVVRSDCDVLHVLPWRPSTGVVFSQN